MLSLTQLKSVCLLHSNNSDQCRYLKHDDNDYSKWYCLKQRKTVKDKIDEKVDEVLADCARKGIDPNNLHIHLGDNCKGYPVLKHILQGIDVTK